MAMGQRGGEAYLDELFIWRKSCPWAFAGFNAQGQLKKETKMSHFVMLMCGGSVPPGAVYTICFILGLVCLLIGKRYFKTLMFFFGFGLTFGLVHLVASPEIAVAVGVMGGLLSLFLSFFAIFLLGGCAVAMIPESLGMSGTIVGAVGVIAGVASIVYKRYVIVPCLAFVGANFIVDSIASLMGGMNGIVSLLLMVLLAVGGSFVQFKYTAKNSKLKIAKEPKVESKK